MGGTFLFRKLRLWDRDDPGWIWREASGLGRMPFAGDSIERGLNADGYVRVYKLDLNPMLPNAYLFREPLRETVSITVGRGADAQVYDFDLAAQWHCARTFWQRLLSIT